MERCAIMVGVMQMKKTWILLLALILILGGLFIWKGGHHAIVLANALEDWLDDDAADQTLSLQVNIPTFTADQEVKPVVRQMSLFADTFWKEQNDRNVYGVTADGYSAYLIDNVLYMDTGAAYALPDVGDYQPKLREFAGGLLLWGRVTKTDRGYRVEMEREGLTFSASVVLDGGVSSVTVNLGCTIEDQPVQILAVLTPKETGSHPLPQTVLDAMVRSAMEPPMQITEPLEVLIPALTDLIPMDAQVDLGVECGILTISETVGLKLDDDGIYLIRSSELVPLSLPAGLSEIDPMRAGLAILCSGTLLRDGDGAEFRIALPAEATGGLVSQLVPQANALGITFTESEAVVKIHAGRLTGISMTAKGEIPFLVTTIPLSFHADLTVK